MPAPLQLFLALAFIVAAAVALTYNNLITLRNRVSNQWSQIDIQLKRRSDLIPKLVSLVEGYAAHEKQTLEGIAKARARVMNAKGPTEAAEASNQLTQNLKSLFAVGENYPTLKANENYLKLQEELTETEERIAFARQFYNEVVQKYEVRRQSFPANLIANALKFEEKEYFGA